MHAPCVYCGSPECTCLDADGKYLEAVEQAEARKTDFARLYAAAPDLLAACKAMAKAMDSTPPDWAGVAFARLQIAAAIARAEGR